ncbi:MAG TPA: DUF5671 domain-containing protein [Candidatus Dormibacteraeota bacterium]|jgi:hypothetical protein|nr:DUF5671 domain-containing protein [Candidatus Dormibacteraeota bacterium]
MSPDNSVGTFIESAKSRSISDQAIVGMLTSQGWSEKEVYAALAAYYEHSIGIQVPSRKGSGTAARDAFFYLLIFSTLATWTIALGALSFDLIDRWLADNLFQNAWQSGGYGDYSIASEMAAILISFPIYLLISRIVVRDTSEHPDKLNSPVRKWLTYMALVIAAGIFIGDLITTLTYLLRGELTSRFIAKAAVVMILSGGVFFYYFGGLRKSDEAERIDSWHRDRWLAIVSAVAVSVMVTLGFSNIGAPKRQRWMRADARRVQDLYQLSTGIRAKWKGTEQKLPSNLNELNQTMTRDPETQKSYEYVVRDGRHYALCADFQLVSTQANPTAATTTWAHPAGHYCFELDADRDAGNPNVYPYF